MCGRCVQTAIFKPDQLGLPDLAQDLLEVPPSYNLAPTQRASVILDRGTGRQVTRLAWGMRQHMLSPNYTTSVHEIPPARC